MNHGATLSLICCLGLLAALPMPLRAHPTCATRLGGMISVDGRLDEAERNSLARIAESHCRSPYVHGGSGIGAHTTTHNTPLPPIIP